MTDDTPYLPFEAARRRVESGDFSFEAVGALCVAHGEKLLRDYQPPRLPTQNMDAALLDFCGSAEAVEAYLRGEPVATKHGLVQLESARAGEAG